MIKCIRQYRPPFGNRYFFDDWYDIIYTDGKYITRVRTCTKHELPKTALKYIAEAKKTEYIRGSGLNTETEIIYERSDNNGN